MGMADLARERAHIFTAERMAKHFAAAYQRLLKQRVGA